MAICKAPWTCHTLTGRPRLSLSVSPELPRARNLAVAGIRGLPLTMCASIQGGAMESLREGGMAATPFLLSLNGYAIYYCFEWGPEGRANTQHGGPDLHFRRPGVWPDGASEWKITHVSCCPVPFAASASCSLLHTHCTFCHSGMCVLRNTCPPSLRMLPHSQASMDQIDPGRRPCTREREDRGHLSQHRLCAIGSPANQGTAKGTCCERPAEHLGTRKH
jgi:hypothetical protein